jgi:hypothetical protein
MDMLELICLMAAPIYAGKVTGAWGAGHSLTREDRQRFAREALAEAREIWHAAQPKRAAG